MNGESRTPELEEATRRGLSRRDVVKLGALAGAGAAGAAFLGGLPIFSKIAAATSSDALDGSGDYPLADPANQLYTACLQCNTGCGVKVKKR